MRNIFLFFFITLIASCSFDNKTGIWNDQKNITITENFSDLKSLDVNKKNDLKKSIVKKDSLFLSSLKRNKNWSDPFLNNLNKRNH